MKAQFAGNKKVNIEADGFKINVDLPKAMGGDNTAPDPFVMLKASLLACSSVHLLFFIEKAGLKKEDFHLELDTVADDNGDIEKAIIKVFIPEYFPQDKESVLKGIISNCKVGKHLKAEKVVELIRK